LVYTRLSILSLNDLFVTNYGIRITKIDESKSKVQFNSGLNFIFVKISEVKSIIQRNDGKMIYININPNASSVSNKFNAQYPDSANVFDISEVKAFLISDPLGSDAFKRKDGETFTDCFVREWQSFCDDTSSCIAQAMYPGLIAVAIGISCV